MNAGLWANALLTCLILYYFPHKLPLLAYANPNPPPPPLREKENTRERGRERERARARERESKREREREGESGGEYGVATISRLLKILGLFCRISSLLYGSFAKKTYHFKEPTNHSHPIPEYTILKIIGLFAKRAL